VSYIGEIHGTNEHLMEARALIQTPRWFDAFPLVILESLASGTPVIAFDQGGIREQIEHGTNGFLCSTAADLAEAMNRVDEINPRVCRGMAEERFSVTRMARQYTELYDQVRDGVAW
jgi:glycosyltransferase involved in cell wall biosynthesis